MSEHTRTPYTCDQRNWRNEPVEHDWYICGGHVEALDPESDDPDENRGSCRSVAIVVGNASSGNITRDTAMFLCRAANSHDALLAACEDALATGEHDMQHILDNGRLRDVLRAAIAKARGE